jgi:hypothetical protein
VNRKWIIDILLPLVGMVIILAVTFGYEGWKAAAIQRNIVTFSGGMIILQSQLVAALVSMGALMMLFWWVMARTVRSGWVGVVFLIIGGGAVAYPYLYLANVFIDPFAFSIFRDALLPGSLLFTTGAGVAMIGLLSLVLPRTALPPQD